MKNQSGQHTLGVLGLIAALLFLGFSIIDYVEDNERKSKPPVTPLVVPAHLSLEEQHIYSTLAGIVKPTSQDALIVAARRLIDGEVLVILPVNTLTLRRSKYSEAVICASVSIGGLECGQPWFLVEGPLTEGLGSGNSLFLSYNPDNGDLYISDRLQFTLRQPKRP